MSASVPEDHTASNDKDVRVDGLVDLDSIATATTETVKSSSTSDDNSATVQRSNKHVQKKKLTGSGRHRASVLSAYESIIFSESQIPVFLTQDHHQRSHRPQLRRQRKGANVSKKYNTERHHQNPIRAEASIPSVIPSSSGDDVAVAQADSSSSSPSLDSGLGHSTSSTVAQDTSVSNNNNLQTDHVVEDEIIAVGVDEDEPSENNDKNSSLHFPASAASPILQVEQDKGESTFVPPSIATEEGGSEPFSSPSSLSFASAGSIGAVEVGNEPSQGADFPTGEEEIVETAAVVVVEDESSSTADEIEDGWVTITNADLVDSDNESSSNIDSNPSSSVEFQSQAESDDIPFTDNTTPTHHHQRNTGTSLFHNGCSSSSVITLMGGLLLTVIGLAYRFHIRKQQLQKQQARRLGASLPLDAKAPLSTSEGKSSVHRLSVDSVSGLKREGDSGRTTAMRDYVGFNMQ